MTLKLALIRLAFLGLLSPIALAAAAEPDPPAKSRTFKLTYQVTIRDLPADARTAEIWAPWPQSDSNQTIRRVKVDAPAAISITRVPPGTNQALYVRFEHPGTTIPIRMEIIATRRENAGRREDLAAKERAEDLSPEPLVPIDGPIAALAVEATRGLSTDAEKARAIYDKVTGMLKYDKSGSGWGRGDALFACDARRGNCTDFHALLIGMARSQGIPARFAIGLPLPEKRGAGEIAGYHCWAEMYVDGRGWVPVDSSEGSKDPARKDYFYGHHDENRIEFSRGRQIVLEPPQRSKPLNFFIYPHVEVDGKPHDVMDRKFTFEDLPPGPDE